MYTVAFLLTPEFSLVNVASAIDTLRVANSLLETPHFKWLVVSDTGPKVASSCGLSLSADLQLADLDEFDLLLVCGSFKPHKYENKQTQKHLRRLSRHGRMLGCMEAGVYHLAKSGALDGHTAAAHYANLPVYAKMFPKVRFVQNVFTISDKRSTCAGGLTGLDLMAHIVTQKFGEPHRAQGGQPAAGALGPRQQRVAERPDGVVGQPGSAACARCLPDDGAAIETPLAVDRHRRAARPVPTPARPTVPACLRATAADVYVLIRHVAGTKAAAVEHARPRGDCRGVRLQRLPRVRPPLPEGVRPSAEPGAPGPAQRGHHRTATDADLRSAPGPDDARSAEAALTSDRDDRRAISTWVVMSRLDIRMSNTKLSNPHCRRNPGAACSTREPRGPACGRRVEGGWICLRRTREPVALAHRLDALLRPRSIALVGASARSDSNGLALVQMARIDGYAGSVLPVNPRYSRDRGARLLPRSRAICPDARSMWCCRFPPMQLEAGPRPGDRARGQGRDDIRLVPDSKRRRDPAASPSVCAQGRGRRPRPVRRQLDGLLQSLHRPAGRELSLAARSAPRRHRLHRAIGIGVLGAGAQRSAARLLAVHLERHGDDDDRRRLSSTGRCRGPRRA